MSEVTLKLSSEVTILGERRQKVKDLGQLAIVGFWDLEIVLPKTKETVWPTPLVAFKDGGFNVGSPFYFEGIFYYAVGLGKKGYTAQLHPTWPEEIDTSLYGLPLVRLAAINHPKGLLANSFPRHLNLDYDQQTFETNVHSLLVDSLLSPTKLPTKNSR